MSMSKRWLIAMGACFLAATSAVQAQYPSQVVGFEGVPIDDPADSQQMFRIPEVSPTTREFIELNDPGLLNNNSAFRGSDLAVSGLAALRVEFAWIDPLDPDAWLRLTTFEGVENPNPSLHLDGQVQFKLNNRGDFLNGEIGIVIGVRETGVDVAQLQDGGTAGPIEWVGVDPEPNGIIAGEDGIVDTVAAGDDVQVYPVGFDLATDELPSGTAVIEPGTNGVIDTTPANDDALRSGYFIDSDGDRRPIPVVSFLVDPDPYTLTFDLAAKTLTVEHVFYYSTPEVFPVEVAGFTGDGVLAADNSRGTLEHLAITNVTSDGGADLLFSIDDLQFEAPVPDPVSPPRVLGPIAANDTSVDVETVLDADTATVYVNGVLAGSATPDEGLATVGGLSLSVGDLVTATQTANGITSDFSSPVPVFAAGTALAEDFDLYANQAELTQVWQKTDPENDRTPMLAQGSAASCNNYLSENIPSGGAASRMYFDLGSVDGSDAEPLIVTYRFRHSNNSGNARGRFELTPALGRTNGAVGFAFTNDAGAPAAIREQYTSLTVDNNDELNGFFRDYFAYDYALTGVAREAGVWQEMQIEVLSDVVNFYVNGQLANPIDPDTLVELYPSGVPRLNTGDFQYVVVGNGFSSNGTEFAYDNISVTLGGTPIPFGPPVETPSPFVDEDVILPGTDSVTISGLDPAATQVNVLVDGAVVASPTTGGITEALEVSIPALGGEQVVSATQIVDGVESCASTAVAVSVPAPTVAQLAAPGQTIVQVNDVLFEAAEEVTVYRDLGGGDLQFLGSVSDPTTASVDVTVAPALAATQFIVATQTVAGVESPPSERVEVRDPGIMGGWVQTSSLPLGLTGHRLVVNNGYVYAIAGRSNESDATTRATDRVYFAAINNDGSIGEWVETTPLPQAKASHGAAAVNGRIYAWGGWTTGYPTVDECYYADPNPDGTISEWVLSSVTIPEAPGGITQMDSFGNGMLSFEDHLYIVNGEINDGSLTNRVYYSTLTPDGDYGPWMETTTTPDTGSWFHGTAIVEGTTENYIYRVAANFGGTNEVDTLRATINSDGSVSEWTEVDADLPFGLYEIANYVVDNKWLFVATGLNGATPQDEVYYAAINPDDGSISEWIDGLPYPTAVSRNAAISYKAGGRHYLLVVSGGPYARTGQRNPVCYYTQVGEYFDMESFATFQRCYDTSGGPLGDCEGVADLNNDNEVDGDDIPELEEYFVGPDMD